METATITTETFPNPHMMSFHTREEISRKHIVMFDRPLEVWNSDELETVGIVGEQIVRGLLDLDGVTHITIGCYEVTVTKAPTFTWEELSDAITAVIVRACSCSAMLREETEGGPA